MMLLRTSRHLDAVLLVKNLLIIAQLLALMVVSSARVVLTR